MKLTTSNVSKIVKTLLYYTFQQYADVSTIVHFMQTTTFDIIASQTHQLMHNTTIAIQWGMTEIIKEVIKFHLTLQPIHTPPPTWMFLPLQYKNDFILHIVWTTMDRGTTTLRHLIQDRLYKPRNYNKKTRSISTRARLANSNYSSKRNNNKLHGKQWRTDHPTNDPNANPAHNTGHDINTQVQ